MARFLLRPRRIGITIITTFIVITITITIASMITIIQNSLDSTIGRCGNRFIESHLHIKFHFRRRQHTHVSLGDKVIHPWRSSVATRYEVRYL
jgi:hypothetical protein